ncbi:asparagine synthase-related protein [Pedobacter sp. SAFR-022]|uniref:asparagine synthase-related protein n=1 Tax=Pedobacter sp. SAFR-022 TaxID=3436861 RepID=UPI003F8102CE
MACQEPYNVELKEASRILSVNDFFLFLIRGAPSYGHTIIKGERHIPFGHVAKPSKSDAIRSWSACEHLPFCDENIFAAAKRLNDTLKSVILNKVANEKKIGILLSGGLDSSIVTYIVSLKSRNVICYTLEYKGRVGTKEAKIAKRLAADLHCEHVVVKIDEKEFEQMNLEILQHHNRPLICWSAINQLALLKQAKRDGCDFVISGMGSDEVLVGYHKLGHCLIDFNKYIENSPPDSWRKYMQEESLEQSLLFTGNTNPFPKSTLKNIFPAQKITCDKYNDLEAFYANLLKNNPRCSIESLFIQQELEFRVGQILLPDYNVVAKIADIEVFYPFLTEQVIKEVANIPFNYKYVVNKSSFLKYPPATKYIDKLVLRLAFEDEIPTYIHQRSTRLTFTAPFAVWIRKADVLEKVFNEILESTLMVHLGIDRVYLRKYFRGFNGNPWRKPFQLWILYQTALWSSRHGILFGA